MAEKSAAGGLTSFSGLFPIHELSLQERTALEEILNLHAQDPGSIAEDLKALIALTSEVKAISHQAALLHGERLKKAHKLLANYKEGAFSAWLIATYGNRQTPYNLIQYYEFYLALPSQLRTKFLEMPRQAIYSLASRSGELQEKHQFVAHYQGGTKNELLIQIRTLFPLPEKDRRRENLGDQAIQLLDKAHQMLSRNSISLSNQQKDALKERLSALSSILKKR